MKINDYPPLAPENFEKMCREWVEVILRHESGTWICAPLFAPYRRILQFKEETDLQRKLFRKSFGRQILIHIDLKQKEDINKEELYKLIKESLLNQTKLGIDRTLLLLEIIDDLIDNKSKTINLFVEGVDASIRNNNWEAIQELNFLAQRNWDTHILLFVSTDIRRSIFFPQFSKRTSLCQNISILCDYKPEDAEYFKKYLGNKWNIKLNADQEKWINENCASNYLLIKESFRQIVKNSQITYEELDSSPSLHIKAEALFDNFLEDEKEVLLKTANKQNVGDNLIHAKELLAQLGWIVEKDGKWDINIPYARKIILEQNTNSQNQTSNELISLTKLERKVFEYLKNKPEVIISREDLAQAVWEDDWEEKYSDWAIDQMMHKIREKIEKANAPYQLITKKGEGFVLLTK